MPRPAPRVRHGEGGAVLGWREIPHDPAGLGRLSRETMPTFTQMFIGRGDIPAEDLERKLYVMRRVVEKQVAAVSRGEPGVSRRDRRREGVRGNVHASGLEVETDAVQDGEGESFLRLDG